MFSFGHSFVLIFTELSSSKLVLDIYIYDYIIFVSKKIIFLQNVITAFHTECKNVKKQILLKEKHP